MPMHSDFEQVRREMRDQYGKEKGDRIFYSWINRYGYDDTKPISSQRKKPKKPAQDSRKSFEGELSFKMLIPIEKQYDEMTGKLAYFGGIASNSDVDRDNERISSSVLQKMAEDLKINSTVFFNHKHDELPIGKVVEAWVENNNLKVKIMPSKAKACEDIITQVAEGVLKSFSIGGKVKKAETVYDQKSGRNIKEIKDLDLYEVSVVGVPANPGASIGDFISKAFKNYETKGEMMKDYSDMDASGSAPSDENEGSLLHTVAGIKNAALLKARDVGAGKVPSQPGGIVSGGTREKPKWQKESESEDEDEAEERKVRKDDTALSRESYGGDLPAKHPGIVDGATRDKPKWISKEDEAEDEEEAEGRKLRKEPTARFKKKDAEEEAEDEAENLPRKKKSAKDEAEDEEEEETEDAPKVKPKCRKRKEDEDEDESEPKHPKRPMYNEGTYKEDEADSPFVSPKMPATRGTAVPGVRKTTYTQITEEEVLSKKLERLDLLEKEVAALKRERRTGFVKGLVNQEDKFDEGSDFESTVEEVSFVKMLKLSRGIQ